MRASADELERTYRRMYHRLIVGIWLICAVLSCGVFFAVGNFPVASAIMNQIGSIATYMQRSAPTETRSIRAAPNCRQKGSWSVTRNASINRDFRQYYRPYAAASLNPVSTS